MVVCFFFLNLFCLGFGVFCKIKKYNKKQKTKCKKLSTSAAKEDHVSMGGYSARKALAVVFNVETVLGIELLCACQAIDLLAPLKTTPVLQKIHSVVRQVFFFDFKIYFFFFKVTHRT